MTLLLDTSILIAIERQDKGVLEKIAQLKNEHKNIPAVSLITYTEMLVGLNKKEIKNINKSRDLVDSLTFLQASKKTSIILADLKYRYDKKGAMVSFSDLFIAAQAKEHNLTLLTKDNDFARIDDIDKIVI